MKPPVFPPAYYLSWPPSPPKIQYIQPFDVPLVSPPISSVYTYTQFFVLNTLAPFLSLPGQRESASINKGAVLLFLPLPSYPHHLLSLWHHGHSPSNSNA